MAGAGAVASLVFDAQDVPGAPGVVDSAFAEAGRVDLVVVAVGLLVDNEQDERDPAKVAECIAVNFAWPAAALARVAEHFRAQGAGRAVVLSSVAGVRVRRANYVYGSAKAGLDEYARNLHQALAGSGAGITVVRPGFVHSKMTVGRPAAPMATNPDAVATDIVRGSRTAPRWCGPPGSCAPCSSPSNCSPSLSGGVSRPEQGVFLPGRPRPPGSPSGGARDGLSWADVNVPQSSAQWSPPSYVLLP